MDDPRWPAPVRRALEVAFIIAAANVMALIVTGGYGVQLGPIRLSAHGLRNPAMLTAGLLLLRVWAQMGGEKFARLCGRLAEAAALIAVAVLPYENKGAGPIFKVSLFAIAFAWICMSIVRRRPLWRHTSLEIPLLAFTAVCAVSAVLAVDPDYSFQQLRKELLRYLLLFFGILNTTGGPRQVRRLLVVLLLSYVSVLAVGAWGFATGSLVYDGRFVSVLRKHMILGKYLVLMLPPILALLLASRGWMRLGWAALLLSGLVALALSLCRGSWVAIFIAFFIVGLLSDRRIIAVLIGIAVVALFVLPRPMVYHGLSIFMFNQYLEPGSVLSERVYLWGAAREMIAERPWIGGGYGKATYKWRYPDTSQPQWTIMNHAHNWILQALVEVGVLGLAAFIWLHATIFVRGFGLLRRIDRPTARLLLIGILAGFSGLFVQGLVTYIYEKEIGFLFWTLSAILFLILGQNGLLGWNAREDILG